MHAQTGTCDTALTYACENGHTDVAEVLLEHGAVLVCCVTSFFFLSQSQEDSPKIKIFFEYLSLMDFYYYGVINPYINS